jgi:hypothetical protein
LKSSAISKYLQRETEKIDQLLNKTEQIVLHLREYRTALITAAVTGKIDVGETIPTSEPAALAVG